MTRSEPSPLTSRQRVAAALRGEPIDRPAIGEIQLDDALVRQAVGLEAKATIPLAARRALLNRLGHDLVAVAVPGADDDLDTALFTVNYWQHESALFVFACIAGPLVDLLKAWGRRKLALATPLEHEQAAQLVADAVVERGALLVQLAASGADGLVIQDDLAQGVDLVLPLPHLQAIYFPFLTLLVNQAQNAGLPVVFSSRGDVRPAIPDLVATGLNGLHGLEPAFGLNPAAVVEASQGLLCPWGGFTAAWLALAESENPSHPHENLARFVRVWQRNLGRAPAIFGFPEGPPANLSARLLEVLYAEVQKLD